MVMLTTSSAVTMVLGQRLSQITWSSTLAAQIWKKRLTADGRDQALMSWIGEALCFQPLRTDITLATPSE